MSVQKGGVFTVLFVQKVDNFMLFNTSNVPQNRPFFIPEYDPPHHFGGFRNQSKKSI